MFKIPDWEDDGPKTNTTFVERVKKKEKAINKSKPQKDAKNNNVTKKEIADNKTKPQKHEKNNNITVNGPNRVSKKRKLESKEIASSKKDTVSNTKKKKFNETHTIPETQSFDEILLNAKKKKFNEVIENDDKEDLLFTENKEKKKTKRKDKNNPNGSVVNNKLTKGVTKQNNEENTEDNKEPITVNNKKARLRSLLDSSHRSPINISKSGNKLRDRMLERLKAAQFRYLNEKLYTSSGSEAQQLFQSDPSAFETYHQGYQLQVKKWPVNPLDVIVKKIMKMPKTHKIADLGCGEAALSRRVPHATRSLDLVAAAPGVQACDMARTPLLSASVDVAVYCLALMGTDLTQYLVEANRILKMGGHLLIAEVESRFDNVENFAKEVERLGFRLKQLDKSNQVFFFMEFTKTTDPPVKKAKLPVLTLKPCLYKRR